MKYGGSKISLQVWMVNQKKVEGKTKKRAACIQEKWWEVLEKLGLEQNVH